MSKIYEHKKIIFIAIIIIIIFVFIIKNKEKNAPASTLDEFAKCLTQKGIIMYGTFWCPHCQNQKTKFEDSFKYITYIECTINFKICTNAGVNGLPTWILSNGQKLEGEQTLEKLSEQSNCPLKQ
ncbi:MAG: protein disulfide isomerase family protein [Candidatus Paceibacterota bacterium]